MSNLLHDGTQGEITNPVYVALTDGNASSSGLVTTTPAASETHVGSVSIENDFIKITPVLSTTPAYTSGDTIGGTIQIPSATRVDGGTVTLDSVSMIDKANQKPQGTLLFFSETPTGVTSTDNAAFGYGAGIALLVGQVPIATADWVTVNSIASLSLGNRGIKMKATTGQDLYVIFVTTSTPTFVSVGDIIMMFGFSQ